MSAYDPSTWAPALRGRTSWMGSPGSGLPLPWASHSDGTWRSKLCVPLRLRIHEGRDTRGSLVLRDGHSKRAQTLSGYSSRPFGGDQCTRGGRDFCGEALGHGDIVRHEDETADAVIQGEPRKLFGPLRRRSIQQATP
jgi:hypothetical protein